MLCLLLVLLIEILSQEVVCEYPCASDVTFPFFAPLSGYTVRTYYRGDGCIGAPFYEAMELAGECMITYDDSGTNAIGSYLIYYCNENYCYTYGKDVIETTSEPTESPAMTTADIYSPSLDPTPLVVRALSNSSLDNINAQLDYFDNKTFIQLEVLYHLLNCQGNDYNTNTSLYNKNPESFIHAGRCITSSPLSGGFIGASFRSQFVQNYNTSYNTSLSRHFTTPAFSFDGYVTKFYTDSSSCNNNGVVLYQTVYPVGQCYLGDIEFNRTGTSGIFYNNLDWVTQIEFDDSSECQGKHTRNRRNKNQICVPYYEGTRITEGGFSLHDPFDSQYLTSSTPLDILDLLHTFKLLWRARIAISGLGACCSLLIILLIMDLKKWTDFNRILFALSVSQLCYDLTFMASKFNDAVVQELYFSSSSAYVSFIALDFIQQVSVTATCLISNILSGIVAYIVIKSRSLQLKQYMIPLAVLIVVIAFPAALIMTVFRVKFMIGASSNEQVDRAQQFVQSIKLVSIILNLVCVLIIVSSGFARYARSFNGQGISRRNIAATAKKKASLTDELVKRLIVYPVVQALTQFPTFWDQFSYQILVNNIITKNGVSQTDDNFYKRPGYRLCWILQYTFTPSAGIWFAIAFILLSKDAQRKLVARIRKSSVCFSGTDISTTKISFARPTFSSVSRPSLAIPSSLNLSVHQLDQPVADTVDDKQEEHGTDCVSLKLETSTVDTIPEQLNVTEHNISNQNDADIVVLSDLDEQQLMNLLDTASSQTLLQHSVRLGNPIVRSSVFELSSSYNAGGNDFEDVTNPVSSHVTNPLSHGRNNMIATEFDQDRASLHTRRLQVAFESSGNHLINVVSTSPAQKKERL